MSLFCIVEVEVDVDVDDGDDEEEEEVVEGRRSGGSL